LRRVVMVGIRTFVDEGFGHSSSVLDLSDGTAAILDPHRLPTQQLATARASGTVPRWAATGSWAPRSTSAAGELLAIGR
jgi:hypothetical protein